jgi:hypothetical protein
MLFCSYYMLIRRIQFTAASTEVRNYLQTTHLFSLQSKDPTPMTEVHGYTILLTNITSIFFLGVIFLEKNTRLENCVVIALIGTCFSHNQI